MEPRRYSAIMGLLVDKIVELIAERCGLDEVAAAKEFYASEVYAILEDEDTDLWHFSPLTIANMFEEEKKKGTFEIPEEG